MDTIKAANKIVKEGLLLLPDEAKGDFKAAANKDIFVNEAIETASTVTGDNLEKKVMLEAVAVREANQMAATLWRLELITPELEKEFRALPPLADVVDEYNVFVINRKAKEDKLSEQFREFSEEKRDIDIFMGIINGIAPDVAEQKYEDFRNAQQQALGGK